MDTWDRCCLIVWIILVARTIAFRGHWEGYLWTPHLHADTWYRLTPHTGYITQTPTSYMGVNSYSHVSPPSSPYKPRPHSSLSRTPSSQTMVDAIPRTRRIMAHHMHPPLLTIATDITLYIMITQNTQNLYSPFTYHSPR